ncbi:hypothetical protein ACP275_14G277900 [Erythranthe tilingii]
MEFFGLRHKNTMRCLSCPLCHKPFRQVTMVEPCCHRFCHNCITKKITEEGLHSCPVCNAHLGSAPLQRLRMDHRWQSMMNNFNNEGRREQHAGSGLNKNVGGGGLITNQPARKRSADEREKSPEKTGDSYWRSLMGENHQTANIIKNATNDHDFAVSCIAEKSKEVLFQPRPLDRGQSSSVGGLKNNRTPIVGCHDKNNVIRVEQNLKTYWFCLVASDNQRSNAPLEQIPSRYLRVQDGSTTVSSIKKYLVQKLNLRSENEVEITLQGRRLLPSLQISRLIELWLQTFSTSERKTAIVGSSAQEFVLPLTYARKPAF